MCSLSQFLATGQPAHVSRAAIDAVNHQTGLGWAGTLDIAGVLEELGLTLGISSVSTCAVMASLAPVEVPQTQAALR